MVPRGAIEQFISQNTVLPCRGEIPGRVYDSLNDVGSITSVGPNQGAAASAARALQIANKLKSPSRNLSGFGSEKPVLANRHKF
jgi:hypothetical protein